MGDSRMACHKDLYWHRLSSTCTSMICQSHAGNSFMPTTSALPTKHASLKISTPPSTLTLLRSAFCKRWRLLPSVAKTMSSTFYLHNARINQELDIILNEKRLKHDNMPTYIGVTLDSRLNLQTPYFGKWLQKPEIITSWCTC